MLRRCRKMACDFIMKVRRDVLRICLIQSFHHIWVTLCGTQKACMLQNKG